MLVFHSAYTYDFIKKYGLEIFVTSRDASGVFQDVLTVSPIASLQYDENDNRRFSKPEIFYLDNRNMVIEGKVARFRFLQRFPKLNFLIAQVSLFVFILKHGELTRIALVRAEDPRFNGLYGYLFAQILRKPFIVGVWGNPGRLRDLNSKPIMPNLFKSLKREEQIESFVLRRAKVVLAQNQENLDFAIQSGVEVSKTCITPLALGIHSSHFLPLSERLDVFRDFDEWRAVDCFTLICISRLESLKMVDHSILAVNVLKESGIKFKLILVGDGRESLNLKNLAKNLGLDEHVIFAGNRTQEWISGAMKFVDVNLAPLCGRSLLEASLSGCPAVAYDVDWHSEIVKDGKSGFLIPNLDYKAMGESLVILNRDGVVRMKMRENMQALAKSIAKPADTASLQKNIYKKLTLL
jgi:glycosyltransferase involved in cell wall biosynthesis